MHTAPKESLFQLIAYLESITVWQDDLFKVIAWHAQQAIIALE